MKLINIYGIKIYVHWTFLFLIGWVILINERWQSSIEQITWSLIFVIAVFGSVALHELGHAITASRFGIKANNIVLLPIGGIASIEKFPDNPFQELLISLAGPLVNFTIAIILWLVFNPDTAFWSIPEDPSITHGHDLVYNLRLVNMGLALFNLIPAFPMDGGRILRALLGFKMNYIKATSIVSTIGKLVAVSLIGAGIILINPVLPIIGLFIIFSASTEEYYLRLKSLVKGIKLDEVLMFDYNSLQTSMTVQEAANILDNNHSKYFVLLDGARPRGSINRFEILKALAEMKYDTKLQDLVQTEMEFLDSNKDVESVLEQMAASDERIFPVMENSHIKGVVNFNHVIEYILLQKAGTAEFERVKSLIGLLH